MGTSLLLTLPPAPALPLQPTWVGCGKHVDVALSGVKEEDRCHCKASQWSRQRAAAETGSGPRLGSSE